MSRDMNTVGGTGTSRNGSGAMAKVVNEPAICVSAPRCYIKCIKSSFHSGFVGRAPATLEKRSPINFLVAISGCLFACSNKETSLMNRRKAVKYVVAGVAGIGGVGWALWNSRAKKSKPAIARAAEWAGPQQMKWDDADLNKFLLALPVAELWSLSLSVGIVKPIDPIPDESTIDRIAWISEIHEAVKWQQSNILTWPFRDNNIHYDDLVRWVGKKSDLSKLELELPCFAVEQAIMLKFFVDVWDKLSPEQRTKILEAMDPTGLVTNRAALALATGTVAVAALASVNLFAGFALYAAMGVFMKAVAVMLGITIPFSVYTGTSATMAFLSGPFGWSLIAIGSVFSLAWLGAADVQKCIAFVCQIHALRAASWEADGRVLP